MMDEVLYLGGALAIVGVVLWLISWIFEKPKPNQQPFYDLEREMMEDPMYRKFREDPTGLFAEPDLADAPCWPSREQLVKDQRDYSMYLSTLAENIRCAPEPTGTIPHIQVTLHPVDVAALEEEPPMERDRR